MKTTLKKRALAVFTVAVVGGSVALSAVDRALAGPADPVVAGIAAYFPDSPANRGAITGRSGIGVVVMNTLQSPGSAAGVADYKGAGKRVFGYFAAGYAPSGTNGISPKSLSQLQSTANAILAGYPTIDGLFLDEVLNNDSAGCAAPAAFYAGFYSWFKSAYPAKSLILNPGTALCSAFAGAADIFLVYENRLGFYRSAFEPYFALPDFDWIRALPNSQVWSIVYGVPVAQMAGLLDEMAGYAGIVTVLSDNADHPYSNVPPTVELDILHNRALGVSLPTTTTIAGATTTTTVAPVPVDVGGGGGGLPVVPPAAVVPAATTSTVASTTVVSTTAPPVTSVGATSTTPSTRAVSTTTRPPAAAAVVLPVRPTTAKKSVPRYVLRTVTRCRTTTTKSGKKLRTCKKVTVRVLVR
jgi:hypothetical protein